MVTWLARKPRPPRCSGLLTLPLNPVLPLQEVVVKQGIDSDLNLTNSLSTPMYGSAKPCPSEPYDHQYYCNACESPKITQPLLTVYECRSHHRKCEQLELTLHPGQDLCTKRFPFLKENRALSITQRIASLWTRHSNTPSRSATRPDANRLPNNTIRDQSETNGQGTAQSSCSGTHNRPAATRREGSEEAEDRVTLCDLPRAPSGPCPRNGGHRRPGLTLRSGGEPTAQPGCRVIQGGRATSVPFTAVLTGPQRTTADNTEAASTCTILHPRW